MFWKNSRGGALDHKSSCLGPQHAATAAQQDPDYYRRGYTGRAWLFHGWICRSRNRDSSTQSCFGSSAYRELWETRRSGKRKAAAATAVLAFFRGLSQLSTHRYLASEREHDGAVVEWIKAMRLRLGRETFCHQTLFRRDLAKLCLIACPTLILAGSMELATVS